jgi:hypothetical protein
VASLALDCGLRACMVDGLWHAGGWVPGTRRYGLDSFD